MFLTFYSGLELSNFDDFCSEENTELTLDDKFDLLPYFCML